MTISQEHTVEDLERLIDCYMYYEINGDHFECEQDFEDEIRELLRQHGYNVIEKHNVRNTNKLIAEQRVFGDPDNLIPDIAIVCDDASVFLELKFCAEATKYEEDIDKANLYLAESKCDVAGVLFLDNQLYEDWDECQRNNDYNYFFELYEIETLGNLK